jgi:hypothetical protein
VGQAPPSQPTRLSSAQGEGRGQSQHQGTAKAWPTSCPAAEVSVSPDSASCWEDSCPLLPSAEGEGSHPPVNTTLALQMPPQHNSNRTPPDGPCGRVFDHQQHPPNIPRGKDPPPFLITFKSTPVLRPLGHCPGTRSLDSSKLLTSSEHR